MRTSPARQDSSKAGLDETVYDPPFIFVLGQERLSLKFVHLFGLLGCFKLQE